MTTLTLDDFTRDTALQPEPKWIMEGDQWVQRDVVRVRSGNGWAEINVSSIADTNRRNAQKGTK